MGVLDKIKNALFEVEYVEVEEPQEKKPKERNNKKENKPIAKKIVLPGKKEQKVEELQEEELKDEDFEIRPKEETVVEKTRDEFKFMDDKDFKVEEEYVPGEPEILQVFDQEEAIETKNSGSKSSKESRVSREEEREERFDEYYQKATSTTHESRPYGMDNSYSVSVHEYGTYEKKEEKTYFKPSPIISPIYGILDKNYKKEDVREKKDVRITSYTRSNVSVDDIRNKAYGEGKHQEEEEDRRFEVEEEEDNLLVDLSDRAKPEVKELTMGDALEYFQDLGLEYNVDYVDVSKEKSTPRRIKDDISPKREEVDDTPLEKEIEESMENPSSTNVIEVKEEKVEETVEEDNDNLFDLIDSMYQEND